MNKQLPYRQIHLDFHTSPLIPDIGKDFDARRFVQTLKDAAVESINIFAKGHHGMCYFPTTVGTMHPNLEFDLFGSMLNACHEAGITAPAYICTGWEEEAARNEQWLEVSMKGVLGGKGPFESGHYRWKKLCHNRQGYVDHILALTDELIESYDLDGFWYDIVFQNDCVCADCQRSMRREGLDPSDPLDVKRNGSLVIERFMKQVRDHIAKQLPDATIYFNMHIDPDNSSDPLYSIRNKNQYQTHIEIESLPSGEWGYNHFPLFVNYLSTSGKQLVGMNGKFHKSWGDFGTLKNQQALEYECFRMTSHGSRCSVGDQLHPRGVLDPVVYERIGKVFTQVRALEPYLGHARKVRDVAVLMSHNPLDEGYQTDEGVLRMLLELHIPFDFIDMQQPLTEYSLLILPDTLVIPDWYEPLIEEFRTAGGKILATFEAGRTAVGSHLIAGYLGISSVERNSYAPSYVRFDSRDAGTDPGYYYCLYSAGNLVWTEEYTAHGNVYASYFNRTYDAFSSHCQSPVDQEHPLGAQCIVSSPDVSYCAYPLFSDYMTHGLKLCRDLFELMLHDLGYERLVEDDLPVTAELTVYHQDQENRDMIHLLHYVPQRKSEQIDIIDTMINLYNRHITYHCANPKKVYSARTGDPLIWIYHDNTNSVDITIPVIAGYEVVVIEY